MAQTDKPQMIYRHLGKTGIKVSVFGFGNWVTGGKVDEEEMYKMVCTAYSRGINMFDTAEVYASGEAETQLGKLIERGIHENKWKRSDLVVSTKLYMGGKGVNDTGLSRKHVIEGMEASLQRLKLSRVDIVFAHRSDRETPMEETVRAFTYLINQGLAHYWGTSEWDAQQISDAYAVARQYGLIPPVVEQPQYSLIFRDKVEKEFNDLYKREIGLGLTIWSPLYYGILTGKYNEGIPDGSRLTQDFFKNSKEMMSNEEGKKLIEKVKALTEIAKELGCSMAQLAIAWTISNENVSCCLIGSSRESQLNENLDSLAVLPKLTKEVLARMDDIVKNKPQLPKTRGF